MPLLPILDARRDPHFGTPKQNPAQLYTGRAGAFCNPLAPDVVSHIYIRQRVAGLPEGGDCCDAGIGSDIGMLVN